MPKNVAVRLSDATEETLQALALIDSSTVSGVIRTAVEEYIERQDRDRILERLEKAKQRAQAEFDRVESASRHLMHAARPTGD